MSFYFLIIRFFIIHKDFLQIYLNTIEKTTFEEICE